MMYVAKAKGSYAQTQSVEADSVEEAQTKFEAGEGEVLDNVPDGKIEVSEVALQEDASEALEGETV